MSENRQDELARLRALALAAGRLLLREQGHYGQVDHKSGTELVTDLDRRVESLLVEGLAAEFPGDAVEAEEGGGGAGRTGRTWHIDPLDGTTNYVHGYPFYCVSLGCADAAGPVLGAVYAPYLDELYLAAADRGVRLQRPAAGVDLALPRRRAVDLQQALLATGFPYERNEVVALNAELVRRFLMVPCHGMRRGGSAAIDLCHVAAGRLDGYWEMKLRPWDVAAGTLVAREAGVRVSDFGGSEGNLSGDSVLAAAPGLYEQMRAILAEVIHGPL
jgi:myo-inositol-1(or 4)-monophosphatase